MQEKKLFHTAYTFHKVIYFQEDYSAGKMLKCVLLSGIDNMQVLCNTACLIANLATSQEDQVRTPSTVQ